jgi:hypothetical protein
VNFVALDPRALGVAEPHLRAGFAGALHWIDPYAVNDPHALTLSYAALFERLGGCFVLGDAATLTRYGAGWRVFAADGSNVEATEAVVALGMAPMRRGIRLTTGAEFARPLAEPTPVQLRRAEPIALEPCCRLMKSSNKLPGWGYGHAPPTCCPSSAPPRRKPICGSPLAMPITASPSVPSQEDCLVR